MNAILELAVVLVSGCGDVQPASQKGLSPVFSDVERGAVPNSQYAPSAPKLEPSVRRVVPELPPTMTARGPAPPGSASQAARVDAVLALLSSGADAWRLPLEGPKLDSSGGIPSWVVRAVLLANSGRLRACRGEPEATVELDLSVSAEGKVETVTATGGVSELDDRCIETVVRSLHFPNPAKQPSRARVPVFL